MLFFLPRYWFSERGEGTIHTCESIKAGFCRITGVLLLVLGISKNSLSVQISRRILWQRDLLHLSEKVVDKKMDRIYILSMFNVEN